MSDEDLKEYFINRPESLTHNTQCHFPPFYVAEKVVSLNKIENCVPLHNKRMTLVHGT